jgi:hypothetical protein
VTSIESWKELYSRFQLILLLETASDECSTLMVIRTIAYIVVAGWLLTLSGQVALVTGKVELISYNI